MNQEKIGKFISEKRKEFAKKVRKKVKEEVVLCTLIHFPTLTSKFFNMRERAQPK